MNTQSQSQSEFQPQSQSLSKKDVKEEVLISCQVSKPEEVAPGVFKTKLHHPLLEGELYFVHGNKHRSQILNAVKSSSLVEDITKVASLIGELSNGISKTPRQKTPVDAA